MLNKEQALHCAKAFSDYFDKFQKIEDYIRDQKISTLSEKSSFLPEMGPDADLFSDFNMHPNDMEFDIVELPQYQWDLYLNMTSSHVNMTSIPGRCLRLAVMEKNTKKWVGFIRLGSPVVNMKPRNEMLGGVFTKSKESAASFNRTSIMGFVLVPSQPFGYNYLGGKLLASISCSHWIREILNKKYDMNTCLFETTSLYGTTKSSSQYDGMKPYLRFKGLTESNFTPLMHGKSYDNLRTYVENALGDLVIPRGSTSRKLKTSMRIISMTKSALKGQPEYDSFKKTIENALTLTEKKRYYISNYGFTNFVDVVMGRTDTLVKDKENYDKFELNSIISWWKKKASNRYESLKNDGRIRKDVEVWSPGKMDKIDIIR